MYAAIFGKGTDRIDLSTGVAQSPRLNGDGGEDIKVRASGEIYLCGQGGIFKVLSSGAFSNANSVFTPPVTQLFNIGFGLTGNLYIGNSASYGPVPGARLWPAGFYAPSVSTSVIAAADINALVVTAACE